MKNFILGVNYFPKVLYFDSYLGDFLISFDVISDVKMDGEGERGGGDSDPGDRVLPSRAWSIAGL